MMSGAAKPLSGKRVFLYFFLFFGMIVAVNAVFITNALKTHSGVVIENAYERGIDYNATIEAARSQPDIESSVSYEDGFLRIVLPIEEATVTAKMFRAVRDGYDFDVELKHVGGGIYEAPLELSLAGAWSAHIKATWNNNQNQNETFQTRYDLIAP